MPRWPDDPLERLMARVHKSGECWLVHTGLTPDGYARFWIGDRRHLVHRYVYERLVGSIPVGLEIDHLCFVRNCCNPLHLEAVTTTENLRRSPRTWGGQNARKTHCPLGHPYDTTARHNSRMRRACKRCAVIASRKRRARLTSVA